MRMTSWTQFVAWCGTGREEMTRTRCRVGQVASPRRASSTSSSGSSRCRIPVSCPPWSSVTSQVRPGSRVRSVAATDRPIPSNPPRSPEPGGRVVPAGAMRGEGLGQIRLTASASAVIPGCSPSNRIERVAPAAAPPGRCGSVCAQSAAAAPTQKPMTSRNQRMGRAYRPHPSARRTRPSAVDSPHEKRRPNAGRRVPHGQPGVQPGNSRSSRPVHPPRAVPPSPCRGPGSRGRQSSRSAPGRLGCRSLPSCAPRSSSCSPAAVGSRGVDRPRRIASEADAAQCSGCDSHSFVGDPAGVPYLGRHPDSGPEAARRRHPAACP